MAKPKYQYELKYEDDYQYFEIYRNDQIIYKSLGREKTDFWARQLYDVINDLLYSSDDNNRKIFQKEEVYLKSISDKKTGNTLSFSNDPKAKEIQKVKDEQKATSNSSPEQIQTQNQTQTQDKQNQEKLNKSEETINKTKEKQKKKKEDLEKAVNDKANFLKDQTKVSPAGAKAAIVAVLLPVLSNFINAEKSANKIINRLINKTKKQLKNKGRVVVNGGKIVFTPKDNGNYQKFKQDFDNKVKSLKKTINILKTTLDTLLTLLKVILAALAAARAYLAILKARLASGDPTVAAEAAAQIPPIEEKIKDYILITTVLTAILSVFQRLVNRILTKLNTLSLTITSQPSNNLNEDLINSINEKSTQTLTYEYTSIDNKEYIIRITTTPSGAKQAVAYEKFSNLKITQTAPSLIRNEDELLTELKQILG